MPGAAAVDVGGSAEAILLQLEEVLSVIEGITPEWGAAGVNLKLIKFNSV